MNKFMSGLFLGIFVVILLAMLIGYHSEVAREYVPIDEFLFTITFSGGMGGLLFAIQGRTLKLPYLLKDDSSFYLGFLSDIFAGLAGAYIIFLILPFELNNSQVGSIDSLEELKIIATGILGGYAGRTILRLAYTKLSLEEVKDDLDKVKLVQDELEKREENDSKALRLLDIQLSNVLEEVPKDEIKDATKIASAKTQELIFYKTSSMRKEVDEKKRDLMVGNDESKNEKIDNLSARIGRTVPVFQALTNSEYGKNKHRYFANLGYALKDQDKDHRDWKGALVALEKAISLSIEKGKSPSPHYYFNKAICLVELDRDKDETIDADEIIDAIKKSGKFYILKNSMLEGLGKELLSPWLDSHNLKLVKVMKEGKEVIDVKMIETNN